jgi:hypothetical protein
MMRQLKGRLPALVGLLVLPALGVRGQAASDRQS